MQFIEKLNFSADLDKMTSDLNSFLSRHPFPDTTFINNNRKYHANQLGLKYRKGCDYPLGDSGDSLFDVKTLSFTGKESDFTEWVDVEPYTKQVIENLAKELGTEFGRIRYMRLMPKTGLSVHPDFEVRYHYVFKTNKYAFFGDATVEGDLSAKCYHIPSDGYFYKVDTTRPHFVFNGGWEPRIHLVICNSWDEFPKLEH